MSAASSTRPRNSAAARWCGTTRSIARPNATSKASGRARRNGSTGTGAGPRCSSGTRRAGAEGGVTAAGGWRRGQIGPLEVKVDAAIQAGRSTRKVVVVRRTGGPVPMDPRRDIWYHELVKGEAAECPPEDMDAEDP